MIILADNITVNPNDQPKKIRRVEIYKNEVYKDVELHSYKHVEASGQPDVQIRNAVSADHSEEMDGAVITRYVEFRNARLRNKLQSVLVEEDREYADDELPQEDNMFRYVFSVPESFRDNTLRALAEYIHRFLVYGALYDWYSQFGMQQAAVYGTELDRLEEEIADAFRGPSIVKRPMQPFGPAYKIR